EMEQIMNTKLVKSLYESAKEMNATQVHVKATNLCQNPEAMMVLGIYNNQRPAHEVLSDLEEALKAKGDKETLSLIEALYLKKEGEI
ncbi:hypothetical protein, partial [Listeria booriae]